MRKGGACDRGSFPPLRITHYALRSFLLQPFFNRLRNLLLQRLVSPRRVPVARRDADASVEFMGAVRLNLAGAAADAEGGLDVDGGGDGRLGPTQALDQDEGRDGPAGRAA